ncbi:MAG: hypothetical protein DMG18_11170 [Acidobacteria bacterium]|nr:MAG: hypothetical protein DMG18_11170 [Acidobacteriota bacterium]
MFGNSLGIGRSAGFPDIFGGTLSQPKRTPQNVAFEENVAERMTGIISDVIRRLVPCHNKGALRPAK